MLFGHLTPPPRRLTVDLVVLCGTEHKGIKKGRKAVRCKAMSTPALMCEFVSERKFTIKADVPSLRRYDVAEIDRTVARDVFCSVFGGEGRCARLKY
ncbi:hypothetical protein F2P81_015885 [Scophthalmus maximus]|uniref:Uncharacterized protein n=1 Tax=Scophthalmus maximus TaxID=52904 RepID=A0A6A4SHI0_SCOMX|nr:hypothetical protein F2P81_015885 [Scophthalmus maximus]